MQIDIAAMSWVSCDRFTAAPTESSCVISHPSVCEGSSSAALTMQTLISRRTTPTTTTPIR